jgi:hypothetical protein
MRIAEQRKRVEEQSAQIAEWERDDYPADRIREARELLKTMTTSSISWRPFKRRANFPAKINLWAEKVWMS